MADAKQLMVNGLPLANDVECRRRPCRAVGPNQCQSRPVRTVC